MTNTPRSLLIRNGTVADGSGAPAREADIEVVDGRIARVAPAGSIAPGRHEVLEAKGLLVTPGFVDPHSHYDGHVMWDDSLAPSSLHGVTTTVMGNCGVGFAPCKPEHRELLIELMEAIEDIPGPVLKAALDWQWTTFPEYLDVLAQRRFDIDVAAQVPHAALRVNVMGERAVRREPATAADRAAMAEQMRAAIRAGALGFSSSRIRAHKTKSGDFTPDYLCAEEELMALALALKAEGKGVLQFVTGISDQKEAGVAEFGILRRLVEASGRPLSMNITQREADPDGSRRLMKMIGEANAAGAVMKGQVLGRGIGLVLGFELTDNPFSGRPSYQELAALPFPERARRLADPAVRRRILDDTGWDPRKNPRIAEYERTWELGAEVAYDMPTGGRRLVQRARGYVATYVAGVPILRDDQPTGERPGRLIRA